MLHIAFFLRYLLGLIILTEISVSMKRLAIFNRKSFPRPRVIEGSPDLYNKYPYVVTLEMKNPDPQMPFLRFCTGSIISSQFVITAAHCLRPKLQFVRCANMSLPVNNSPCLSKVLKQIPHPLFFDLHSTYFGTLYNDIALLQIEKLEMSSYGRLNFVDYKTLMGRAVKYAGFGQTMHEYKRPEDFYRDQKLILYIGEGVIFKDEDDELASHPQLLIASKCSNRKQQAHSGDSGGPLFVDNKIVGVLSSFLGSLDFGVTSHPPYLMFTAVSPYVDWIRRVVKN